MCAASATSSLQNPISAKCFGSHRDDTKDRPRPRDQDAEATSCGNTCGNFRDALPVEWQRPSSLGSTYLKERLRLGRSRWTAADVALGNTEQHGLFKSALCYSRHVRTGRGTTASSTTRRGRTPSAPLARRPGQFPPAGPARCPAGCHQVANRLPDVHRRRSSESA